MIVIDVDSFKMDHFAKEETKELVQSMWSDETRKVNNVPKWVETESPERLDMEYSSAVMLMDSSQSN
jgi:hypothetical protein